MIAWTFTVTKAKILECAHAHIQVAMLASATEGVSRAAILPLHTSPVEEGAGNGSPGGIFIYLIGYMLLYVMYAHTNV